MSLDLEIKKASQDIVKDGYDMSIGELINLYRDEELVIDPEFQRYFRWDETRKTRFIESILLGIPIPPIFVFQKENGVWELIDGLQRLSTIFQFNGILKKDDDNLYTPLELEGTKLLPSLKNKKWTGGSNGISKPLQLQVKRARIRVEILTKGSDPQSKYELFQRLNTGGASLTEQEVRNCIMVKVNAPFYTWIKELSQKDYFFKSLNISKNASDKQKDIEHALRFFIMTNFPYEGGVDVNEYLDDGMFKLASDPSFDTTAQEDIFAQTFQLINSSLGENAFKKYDGQKFLGQFLISAFEALSYGISKNIIAIQALTPSDQETFIISKTKALWQNQTFISFVGGGIRGTTRLLQILPFAKDYFKP